MHKIIIRISHGIFGGGKVEIMPTTKNKIPINNSNIYNNIYTHSPLRVCQKKFIVELFESGIGLFLLVAG
ncbi:hypothetical protein J6TS7_46650 [Paenibacillus dendritiformis]|nr:hypothetical protein J6TS7_46650 [Paenibacillus dendritiformis]